MNKFDVIRAWGRILSGRRPSLSIEITRECPLRCPGCYAYEDGHLGDAGSLRSVADYKGEALVEGVMDLLRRHQPLHEAAGRRERRGEAEEQVGEQDEQLDVSALEEVLGHPVGMRRGKAADRDEQRDREEGEREPARGPGAAGQPEANRDDGQRDQADRVQDPDADDKRVQTSPRSRGARNRTLNTILGAPVTIRP